ncbi:MAG TPA: serine protease [Microbacterium sp.]|nr:serine protease [Microbacterium sp.]
MTSRRIGAATLAVLIGSTALAGCSALPQGPDPLPSTFIPRVSASASADAGLVGGFAALERDALRVRVRTCDAYGTGSAFAIDATHAVTNAHVAEGATDITVTGYDGKSYRVTSSVLSREADLALLTIKDEFPNLVTLADEEPAIGDTLSIAGYPRGEALKVTSGPYFGETEDTVGEADDRVYQIDAETHPGNSGSAVANDDGDVVGVVYASDDVHATFAVSLPTLKNFLDNLDDAKRNRAECESQG